MKREQVAPVFEDVAPYYDDMNDYLSLGSHHLWKAWFCQQFTSIPEGCWLDLATGTADILVGAIKRGVARHYYALDPSQPMLSQAKLRLAAAGYLTPRASANLKITFIESVAEDLSFLKNESIDGISCAFGLRNMSDRPQALREISRVLKSGAVCHILEFAPPDSSIPMQLYGKYLRYGLPVIGQLAFGDRDSYEYLGSSIQDFWTPGQCERALADAGLINIKSVKVFGGIAYYYQGARP